MKGDDSFIIKGVCYHPVAIGEEKRSFDRLTEDLALMQALGVNTIRVYEPIASREVLDEIHAAGLSVIIGFGFNQGGVYDLKSGTYLDYILAFKSHPAILLWELGNEYNYHPEWFGGSLDVWYETLKAASAAIQAEDPLHPVSTAHGEVPDEALLASLPDIDVWGLNVYRWDVSYTAALDFAKVSDKPMYFSELGSDSYMKTAAPGYDAGENQSAQADATQTLLTPIFSDAVPSAGVAVFSFTDGWWKAGAPDRQDVGGWAPASTGVPYDGAPNEEYWGLVDIHRVPKEAFAVVQSLFNGNTPSPMTDGKRKKAVYETSRNGGRFHAIPQDTLAQWNAADSEDARIVVKANQRKQKIEGFGGSFTDASAYLVHQLSPAQRQRIMEAYFAPSGANYSLTRTHMNSCDFSRFHYSYAPVEGDLALEHFSIEQDLEFIFPMIQSAQAISKDGFQVIASPWTAPPWMKDNNDWVGGRLLKEMQPTWAQFFVKYAQACEAEGIPLWGFTVENEPHGNGNNWESMLYSPDEMTEFVQQHLGPALESNGLGHLGILGYDQNRAGLDEWTASMYRDSASAKYFAGTAIHWYESTYDYFPDDLDRAHAAAPDKLLIETEGCIDAEVPVWQDDDWYWRKEATDWGFTWREEEKKYLHPKYSPVNRYARDIIGCLNHWVNGWVDWNMVLDRQGGPNWFKNWCIAPVIVDPEQDEVYFTPLYDVMSHFSKFIRPGATVLASECTDEELMAVATEAPDGGHVIVCFNPGDSPRTVRIEGLSEDVRIVLDAQALQTVVLAPH
jgi:glucosylceramidase